MSLSQVEADRHRGHPDHGGGGLWSRGRRSLTVGLVLTITLVAFEALAVSTIMPIVARELQRHRALRLGVHGVHARLADRHRRRRRAHRPARSRRPVRRRPRPVRDRPHHRWPGAVDAGPRRRPLHPGPRGGDRSRRSRTWPSAGACRSTSDRRCSRRCRPRGSCPACSDRPSPGSSREVVGWRWVFLGLLPLIVALVGHRLPGRAQHRRPTPTDAANAATLRRTRPARDRRRAGCRLPARAG